MGLEIFELKDVLAIREEMKEALRDIEKKWGVSFTFGSHTQTDLDFKMSTFCVVNDENGELTPEALDFKRYAKSLGIKKKLGDVVMISGEPHTIVGLRKRSKQSPLTLRDSKGNDYACPARYGF